MPIYEYVCPNCKLKFEMLRTMSQADAVATCPECSTGSRRVPSTFCGNSEDGPIGGSSCGTCSSASCSTCSLG
ncbi:MAG: zinc ribbon domain-containing protein [Dehalococcoidia bacterium]